MKLLGNSVLISESIIIFGVLSERRLIVGPDARGGIFDRGAVLISDFFESLIVGVFVHEGLFWFKSKNNYKFEINYFLFQYFFDGINLFYFAIGFYWLTHQSL
jgi:hypothetical protein